MNKKYLILSDLDQTLLTTDKRITNKTKKFIKKIVDEGHIFCFSTGRPLQGCINYFNDLNINCPIVTENGSNIYFPENDMKPVSFLIPLNVFKSLLKDVDKILVSCFTGTKTCLLIENESCVPPWIVHENEGFSKKVGKIYDMIDEDPFLPSFIVSDAELMKTILSKYPDISYRFWGKNEVGYTFEIYSKNASKGQALRYLKNHYNIDDECTIAFGDELNDLPMIEEAYYGVAMINGKDDVKKRANMITKKDNDHNGVIKHIKYIMKKQK